MSLHIDGIDESMLNIDSAGIESLEIADQFFVSWWCLEGIFSQQFKKVFNRIG